MDWLRIPQAFGRTDSGQNSIQRRVEQNPQLSVYSPWTPEMSRLQAAQDISWSDPELQRQLMMYYLLQQQNILNATPARKEY